MVYIITKKCEIANKKYSVGDPISEKDTPFFASVMKKQDGVAIPEAKAKASEEVILTKKEMLTEIEKIKYTGDLNEEQTKERKVIKTLNAPELKVEYEKIVAEAKAKAKASEGSDAE